MTGLAARPSDCPLNPRTPGRRTEGRDRGIPKMCYFPVSNFKMLSHSRRGPPSCLGPAIQPHPLNSHEEHQLDDGGHPEQFREGIDEEVIGQ